MCLKPQAPRTMPEGMRQLGISLMSPDNPYRLVGEQLYEKHHDEDFADLYPSEGQPAMSPVDLAFVTVFQDLEDLSDRQAAEAMRLRLDWKYALHRPVNYAGFNFSVLSEYRSRLLANKAESRVFVAIVDQFKEMGMIKAHGRQRTDSLAVLTRVRTLNRIELVVETLRLTVVALLAAEPEWMRATLPPSWEDRYGKRCVAERLSENEKAVLQAETGQDGQWLLERLSAAGTPKELSELPEVRVLRTVWEQQYEVRDHAIIFRKPGAYDGEAQIQSPHDPEARWSKKRDQEWIGDKLQVTETDDEGLPHLITDIALTSSVEGDKQALGEIQQRQAERDVAPARRFADEGYISGATLAASLTCGEDLVGPAPAAHSPQSRLVDGITLDQFELHIPDSPVAGLEQGSAQCPGNQHAIGQLSADGSWHFKFAAEVCAACPLQTRCCTGKGGRSLTLGPHYAELEAARQRQQTEAFKKEYRLHRGGIEGCLSALVRGQGVRVNRYTKRAKNNLRALFVAAAVNLRRVARWMAGIRPQQRHSGFGLAEAG
jgi:transposase